MKTQHQRRFSLAQDGSRKKIHIGDVAGRFTTWRRRVFFLLIAFYALAPFIKIGGKPLIFIDILQRRFYLFGETFNAQDVYLGFFFLTGAIVLLLVLAAVAGRLWCGWACPQTVFMEGVFRRIERWAEGPKVNQLKIARGWWSGAVFARLAIKHILFIAASFFIANIFISYFVSLDQLMVWMSGDPREHWTAFSWMLAVAFGFYFNFAWFREQTCVILCPYGRLQSALTDDDTQIIGYDELRGEPKGRPKDPRAGDCVDCYRCVDVCPTGIDIREGLQLECIGCANCIDACDDIMFKLGRKPGLVRYDSYNGFNHRTRRIWRPRLALYLVFLLVFAAVGTSFVMSRKPFEASLMRQQGSPYILDAGVMRNQYLVHIVNKTSTQAEFEFSLDLPSSARSILPLPRVTLGSLEDRQVPILVLQDKKDYQGQFMVTLRTTNLADLEFIESRLLFLGP